MPAGNLAVLVEQANVIFQRRLLESKPTLSSSVVSSTDVVDVGPNLQTMSWFDKVRLNAELMQGLLSGSGLPAWFIRKAWLSLETEQEAVVHESAHPYTCNVPSTEIIFPDAVSIEIRIDSKSASANGTFVSVPTV